MLLICELLAAGSFSESSVRRINSPIEPVRRAKRRDVQGHHVGAKAAAPISNGIAKQIRPDVVQHWLVNDIRARQGDAAAVGAGRSGCVLWLLS